LAWQDNKPEYFQQDVIRLQDRERGRGTALVKAAWLDFSWFVESMWNNNGVRTALRLTTATERTRRVDIRITFTSGTDELATTSQLEDIDVEDFAAGRLTVRGFSSYFSKDSLQ